MIADVFLVLLFMGLGVMLGLVTEVLKYFYPIYFALLLLIAAQFLNLLGKMIKLCARR
jgi:hypothetical protein